MLPWRSADSRWPTEEALQGRRGERAAERFLRKQGYKILVRNYATRRGEIDLVCRHEGTLVFVEVKAREEGALERPASAVHRAKQRRIIWAAYGYLQELGRNDMPTRFDVVEVWLRGQNAARCEVIPHAFQDPSNPR